MDEPVSGTRPPAPWPTRAGAWLIDLVLVGAVVGLLGDPVGLGGGAIGSPVFIAAHGTGLFGYWTAFEFATGRSPGKLLLDLEVVDEDGRSPSIAASAIQSFGKAFLLPLDVLVGVLVLPGRGLRLFNRLSGTRVVAVDTLGPRNRGPSAVEA